jgi:hypothetical protein
LRPRARPVGWRRQRWLWRQQLQRGNDPTTSSPRARVSRMIRFTRRLERLTGETHARYLPMPRAEVRRWSKLEHDRRPHWPGAALHCEPILLAPARRYPIRKMTTPAPIEGVAGGALPMSAGTSFHGRRKPNGSACHRPASVFMGSANVHEVVRSMRRSSLQYRALPLVLNRLRPPVGLSR